MKTSLRFNTKGLSERLPYLSSNTTNNNIQIRLFGKVPEVPSQNCG